LIAIFPCAISDKFLCLAHTLHNKSFISSQRFISLFHI
jgi:hypothetical protein